MAKDSRSMKRFDVSDGDVRSSETLLFESVTITGSVVSGTYSGENIKNYTHGMFQSVFNYPHASASANHLYDLTLGYSTRSSLHGSSNADNQTNKVNMYNEMAQILVGFDATGSVQAFDNDGDIVAGGAKTEDAIFLNFARLQSKDGIKKGSFNLELGVSASDSGYTSPFGSRITIKDANGTSSFLSNSPSGEYGILYASNSSGTPLDGYTTSTAAPCGLLYYQAGVAMLSSSLFETTGSGGLMSASVLLDSGSFTGRTATQTLVSSSISGAADAFNRRIYNLTFNNTTELYSTLYVCTLKGPEFNYSSNPTYIDSKSRIRVKGDDSSNNPKTFITTIGLYSEDDALLAVAKLSEPIEKDPDKDHVIKVRLDY